MPTIASLKKGHGKKAHKYIIALFVALMLLVLTTHLADLVTTNTPLNHCPRDPEYDAPPSSIVARSSERRTLYQPDTSPFPSVLQNLGVSLLGRSNMEKLIAEAMNKTAVQVLDQEIILTSHKDDDSIPRLQSEFRDGGSYKFASKIEESNAPIFILDVGGNIGFTSIAMHRFHPSSQIIVFEPHPLTYIYLRWNLVLNKIYTLTSEELHLQPPVPGIYPVFGGLGAGEEPFVHVPIPTIFADRSQNHVFGVSSANIGLGNRIFSPRYSFSHFVERHKLIERVIDIAKFDCECCEYLVLPSNDKLFANRSLVRKIVGELHPFEKCKSYFDLSDVAQSETLATLEHRGCTLSAEDFDENHNVQCCPPICPSE